MREMARRFIRRADRVLRGGGRGIILLYHRIASDDSDPYGLCVAPRHFEDHLAVIHSSGYPMSVADMTRALKEGSLPDRAIGITFDDAYLDVLEVAVPMLRSSELPATVFATVGPGGREREFWWDGLGKIFLQPGGLPRVLHLVVDARRWRWDLGIDAEEDGDRQEPRRGWHLLDEQAPTARHAAFREIYHLLRPLSEEARTRALEELHQQAGKDPESVRASRRVMSPEQLGGLTSGALIDVGAHTVTHPALPSKPVEVQRTEVHRSKEVLEDWTGTRIEGFAYPYGLYDDLSLSVVRDAGFSFACGGDHRVVGPGSDPLLLPRIDVPPGDASGLESILRRYLG